MLLYVNNGIVNNTSQIKHYKNIMNGFYSRKRSVSTSNVTPSLSSMMSQVKRKTSLVEEPRLSISKRRYSDNLRIETHPLDNRNDDADNTNNDAYDEDEEDPMTGQDSDVTPNVKLLNIHDLDLTDNKWTPEYIQCFIEPIYSRSKRQAAKTYTTNETIFTKLHYELEPWPTSREKNETDVTTTTTLLPNRRMRQKTENSNFWKLLAVETSCIQNQRLPEVYINNRTMAQLNVSNYKELNYSDDIKLAILTKLKLWTENNCRSDLFGEVTPWNLEFKLVCNQDSVVTDSSIVRAHSNVVPWLRDNDKKMMKPCGKLKLGRSHKNEIQYVVKGWCDSRFT
ncbi:hypothetical protein KAFR_0B02780 [Kazachstania africana CBS 2517]|uniref:Uncharacterized protein n=1 Tax=Kazachstania africana (strain ATCC 22294 / BCRC 22015 / CBS 2517 / CECT 1963 / NBRC 1671 / NRRL Y-8276) TaxID=1071382 RepID=H2AQC5_KAZAF|nr:hypothetical protein KAFR_0B02780 [Kazachstania africana CBS 2517]CCF56575.1 hypothetical protein KAFR_0B02780 [Kazachstania africana CBS 2517]